MKWKLVTLPQLDIFYVPILTHGHPSRITLHTASLTLQKRLSTFRKTEARRSAESAHTFFPLDLFLPLSLSDVQSTSSAMSQLVVSSLYTGWVIS